MSDVREKLAGAVTMTAQVDGADVELTGHTRQPDVVSPFDAWPIWTGSDWVNPCVFTTDWQVIVALPAGAPDVWHDAGDDLQRAIGESLWEVAKVRRCDPASLVVSQSQGASQVVPVLQYTVTAV